MRRHPRPAGNSTPHGSSVKSQGETPARPGSAFPAEGTEISAVGLASGRNTERSKRPHRYRAPRASETLRSSQACGPQGRSRVSREVGSPRRPPAPGSAADDPVNSPAGLRSVIRPGLLISDVWYTGCKEVNFQNFILMPSDAMRGHIPHRAQIAAEELPAEAPQPDWRSSVPLRAQTPQEPIQDQ